MKRLFLVAATLALAACASTPDRIVGPSTDAQGNKTAPPPAILASSGIVADIQGAASNLDQAISIGVLPAGDPAAKCAHDALAMAGVEVAPGDKPSQSFVPKKGSPLTDASVLYIIAQQAKSGPGFTVDTSCKALLGQLVIDGLTAARKAVPSLIVKGLGL